MSVSSLRFRRPRLNFVAKGSLFSKRKALTPSSSAGTISKGSPGHEATLTRHRTRWVSRTARVRAPSPQPMKGGAREGRVTRTLTRPQECYAYQLLRVRRQRNQRESSDYGISDQRRQ